MEERNWPTRERVGMCLLGDNLWQPGWRSGGGAGARSGRAEEQWVGGEGKREIMSPRFSAQIGCIYRLKASVPPSWWDEHKFCPTQVPLVLLLFLSPKPHNLVRNLSSLVPCPFCPTSPFHPLNPVHICMCAKWPVSLADCFTLYLISPQSWRWDSASPGTFLGACPKQ